ncbi:Gfo/Idh/MocA family protein [Leadbettera azotonutricia]|uniref:Oxidoreductase, Gfo/Idh/MocA family n=1 Tax=Leadbettera azotonutricia (strain ATCC BAA-888 / DSM 13862 / ZAS-9) TaxID=545695 RepID=F5Y822_LEAAZ|nr:Gfo/Idh/MocA family oxidoreductase [Leadbettera azotonutricia]AEF80535.1 oxidoreductase, Gfo/Idh/MocA family [Leadbettera azotonutricia ZAS-9]
MVFKNGKNVKVGIVGLGGRGRSQMSVLLDMEDVEVAAVCDVYEDRAEAGKKLVQEKRGKAPFKTTDFKELLKQDLESVVITCSWENHITVAIAAMEAGKQVAMEVGGASSLNECWSLVRTAEKTGKTCMLLENCCYGKEEMQILNMVKKGLFGEVIHCQGGYHHDLREEVGWGDRDRHYRQNHFHHRNGELYPTHELGPIAKVLDINRGNRMVYLTAMASKARGMKLWAEKNRPGDPVGTFDWNEGDIVTTSIRCANGETIILSHDCTLPRPYSRGGYVHGTKGIWMEDNASVFLEGLSPENENYWTHAIWEPFQKYEDQYGHPLWKAYENYGVRGGHDGMDFLVLRAFVESVQNRTPAPIDVYDAASWMAITCLSEMSISRGSMPVDIPDFTDGRWINREKPAAHCYSLDGVWDTCFA